MKKTHHDFPKEILSLFDKFVHGDIDRRGFIEGAGKFAISASVASGYLASLVPDFANAQKIAPNHPDLWIERIRIPSKSGSGVINAYLARPKNLSIFQKLPVIIVCHENRGLNPHIEDITRRIALNGYIAIAPDALTALGGYPGNEDKARELFAKLDQNKIREDFLAAVKFADITEHGNDKVGVIGFCWGGGMANYLAANSNKVNAAIAFYGAPPPLEKVPNIKGKLLLHFAQDDERFNAMWPDYEKALKANHKDYVAFVYPNTVHGFNNDTTPRYNEKMANLAWNRSMNFFNNLLKKKVTTNIEITNAFETALAANEIKGGAYALFEGNKIVFKGAFGTGRGDAQLTTKTKVRVASISKLVTAFCAWKLASEKRFDLDGDISKYLGFKLRNPHFPDAIISARHILSHSSSIRDDGENYRGVIGETLESFFTPNNPNWVDGNHFSDKPIGYFCYSNLGLGLIAQCIENISGQRFDIYAHDNIIKPMGMDCGFNWSLVSDEDVKNSSPLFRRLGNDSFWTVQTDGDPISKPRPIVNTKDNLELKDYKIGTNGLILGPQGGLRANIENLATIGQVILGANPFFDDGLRANVLKDVWKFDGTNAEKDSELITDYATGVGHIKPDDRCPIQGLKTTLYGHYGEAYGLLAGVWVDTTSQKGFAWFINSSLETPQKGGNSGLYAIEETMMNAAARDLSLI